MDKNVTCIIPCHNCASTIERAVQSAIDAGCVEVYAYDDHSTDDTYNVLYHLQGIYEPFSILASPQFHTGVNFARNQLIDYANDDDLIICLDADDTLHDISPLIAAWQPGTWVYGDHNEVSGEQVTRMKGAPVWSLARKNVTGVTFLFAKEDWQRVGGFDPDFAYAEDYQLQCAFTHAGIRGQYVDTVVYNRYIHPHGNERTTLAGDYWSFYRDMARRKYPTIFTGTS